MTAGAAPGASDQRRLPRDFRLLWSSYGAANLADGVLLSAGPVLVTSVTRAPFAVSAAVLVQRLPWLLFGLLAGVVVDRVDRRRLQVLAHAARAIVLAGLVAVLVTGRVGLPEIYVALFLLGCAEVFADNAGGTLVVATVPRGLLGRANARLVGTRTIANQLAGPPLGAVLFGVAVWLPFGVNVLLLAAAAVLVSRLRSDGRAEGRPEASGRVRDRIAEGWRWLAAHPPVRRLAVLIALFNLSFGAAYPVWILYAFERLGLDEVGYGLLLTASAVGAVIGSALFGRLERRFSYAAMLRVGLLVETGTHLGLALTDRWFVAAAILVLFGVHEAVWGSLSATIRQRAVPEHLLGRVNSVYLLAVLGPFAVGTLLGGVLAQRFGVLAPFWYAFAGAALTTAWVWRSIEDLGAAGDDPSHDGPRVPPSSDHGTAG